MKFRLVPPGEFLMGSTQAEIEPILRGISNDDKHWQECIKSEAPRHVVILTQPRYLGQHEVTQAQYQALMGINPSNFAATGSHPPYVEKVKGLETSTHPVENVAWNDAAEFCTVLSQRERYAPCYRRSGETVEILDGTGYRLPTSAECEFACRAGTTTRFWFGDEVEQLHQAGWFEANANGRTHPVGELRANPFALSDITGNVWEWTQDRWSPTYYSQFVDKPAIDPRGPVSNDLQLVIRGGHCLDPPTSCRSS